MVRNKEYGKAVRNKAAARRGAAPCKRSAGGRAVRRLGIFAVSAAICMGIILAAKDAVLRADGAGIEPGIPAGPEAEGYPEELISLLERNEETLDYVTGYTDREEFRSREIDLSGDYQAGQVPLLMQWDRRWGYDAYGDEMIGLSGCGPVCLNMAYLYFTGDTSMTPREMAAYAYENGYYTREGTSWSLWTEGTKALGLQGEELPLDEKAMKSALDAGGLIVCSMRPGDFTTIGHFILIRGYDDKGFYVNDPNRRSNSGRQWDYDTLYPQIRNLWVLQK